MNETHAVWEISGFEALVFLAVWTVAVLFYGLFWRSMNRPEPDPIRPPGPVR